MKKLSSSENDSIQVCGVASVQEEVGLRGATLNLDTIKPDLAIVLDCSSASLDDTGFGILGNGVLIRYFDRAMVAFKELLDLQIKVLS